MKLKQFAALAALTVSLAGCSATQHVVIEDPSSWVDGACSETEPGVTLSVDFKGKVTTHCARNYKGDGWNLFNMAGIPVKGTAKYPTAFACQINGEPAGAKCDESETSGAYWGYYIAVDGKWAYATTGASDHKSSCGENEGWVYMETEKTVSHLPNPTTYVCK